MYTLLFALSALTACSGDKDAEGDTAGITVADDTGVFGDADGDGYALGDDCDDDDASVYPGASESCDGEDEDCDDVIDEDAVDGLTYYADADADGYGDPGAALTSCEAVDGYVSDGSDCDDVDPLVNPAADEICDGADNNCDSLVDDDDPALVDAGVWYLDADDDGYGADDLLTACEGPEGYTDLPGDCDDDDSAINPGAAELCDGVDNDCEPATSEDGLVTLSDAQTFASLQDAADVATPGDSALVCPGAYGPVSVSANLTLTARDGAEATVIDAGGAGSAVTVTEGELTLVGFTLTGGVGADYDSTLGGGGVAAWEVGPVELRDCVIEGNTADVGGGVLATEILLVDSVIRDNTASYYGGGVYTRDVALSGTTISGNAVEVEGYGGGLFVLGGGAVADDATVIVDNTSDLAGGGVVLWEGASLEGGEVSGNYAADQGGGVYIYLGGLLAGVAVLDNTTDAIGGGVLALDSELYVDGATLSGNTAEYAGGLYAQGTSGSIIDSSVDSNDAAIWGGGLYLNDGSDLVLEASNVYRNGAGERGGGAIVDSSNLESVDSNWGVEGNENTPDDLVLDWDDAALTYGADEGESFYCSADEQSCVVTE